MQRQLKRMSTSNSSSQKEVAALRIQLTQATDAAEAREDKLEV